MLMKMITSVSFRYAILYGANNPNDKTPSIVPIILRVAKYVGCILSYQILFIA